MRKVTFKIDEIKYCRDILKTSSETAKDIRATLIVTGDSLIDDFKIFDENNNEKHYGDYSIFVRSCIFYECFKYFENKPYNLFGVVDIKEETF